MTTSLEEIKSIGTIGNYYGCLSLRKNGNKFEWSIKNYSGDDWDEIPDYLFQALTRFEDERLKGT